jgi:hypothetical protein
VKENFVIQEYKDTVKNIISWLSGNEEAESDKIYWPKALGILEQIEKEIPGEGRILHGFRKEGK